MAWSVQGNLKGPQGDPGVQGNPGPPGADGAGIEIAGSVATYAALPTGLGPEDAGSGYLVESDGKLYIWTGASFPANGAGVEFRGPPGPPGADGADSTVPGPPGADSTVPGPPGNDGAAATIAVGTVSTGAAGSNAAVVNVGTEAAATFNFTIPRGDTGAPGTAGANGTRWYFGTGAPATIPGSVVGDAYLDMADGTVYRLT